MQTIKKNIFNIKNTITTNPFRNLSSNFSTFRSNSRLNSSSLNNKLYDNTKFNKNNFIKINIKNYFSYPCPRKLNELVKISLFEKEQPSKIKDIWEKYFNGKENTIGLNISGGEMNLALKK